VRKRAAIAALLTAVLAFTASAEVQISQNLLDHEARTRAAFTPAEKAREAALEARLTSKMSVADVMAMTRGETQGTIFAVLMEYQKMMGKEAREDRKLAQAAKETSKIEKAAKLENDARQIDKLMSEANEKARNLMNAATTSMVMGIVSAGGGSIGAQGAGGATQLATAQAPAGAAASPASSSAARGLTVPTRTPTKAPGGGK